MEHTMSDIGSLRLSLPPLDNPFQTSSIPFFHAALLSTALGELNTLSSLLREVDGSGERGAAGHRGVSHSALRAA